MKNWKEKKKERNLTYNFLQKEIGILCKCKELKTTKIIVIMAKRLVIPVK